MVKACHLHIRRNELLSLFQCRGDRLTKPGVAHTKACHVYNLPDNWPPTLWHHMCSVRY